MNRSYLFVPASNAGMILSSMVLPADAIIFDLEDGVALNQKGSARSLLKHALETLEFSQRDVFVRVNHVDSPHFKHDIELCLHPKITGVVLPKASMRALSLLEHQLVPRKPVILLIESALGVLELTQMCQKAVYCVGLLLGGEDLSVDCDVERTQQGNEIDYARKHLLIHAKAFGLTAIDTPYVDIENMQGLKEDTRYAASLGYDAKAAINPRQIDGIHEALMISDEKYNHAREVVQRFEAHREQGVGVFTYQGKMIDEPIYLKAKKVVEKVQLQRGKP